VFLAEAGLWRRGRQTTSTHVLGCEAGHQHLAHLFWECQKVLNMGTESGAVSMAAPPARRRAQSAACAPCYPSSLAPPGPPDLDLEMSPFT